MDYLQYSATSDDFLTGVFLSFKPYYKWITFNTLNLKIVLGGTHYEVLNLIINGLPSIL